MFTSVAGPHYSFVFHKMNTNPWKSGLEETRSSIHPFSQGTRAVPMLFLTDVSCACRLPPVEMVPHALELQLVVKEKHMDLGELLGGCWFGGFCCRCCLFVFYNEL